MAAANEPVPTLPSQFAEICASLTMRCQKCDSMTDSTRVMFLDKVKNPRLGLNLLVKALCEFHPTSHWSLFLWDRVTSSDAADKELLTKYMFCLGRASPNLSVFNLWIGCPAAMTSFQECRMPQTVPMFASQSILSRPCNTSVSWEKIMLKLDEAMDVDVLTAECLLPAALACRMLILVEGTEKSPVLRVKDEGKRLVNEVSPCPLPLTKAWPASSMSFYVIFGWMKRTRLVEQAMEEFMQSNRGVVERSGDQLVSVTLVTHDAIRIRWRSLNPTCGHDSSQKSSFDYPSGTFPTSKGCIECNEPDDQSETLYLVATPKLLQVMVIMKMVNAYLLHNNSGELHRDSMLACMLYILMQGVPSKAKRMNMEALGEVLDAARETAPGTVVPPLAACDYRTPEGRHRRRKPVKHQPFVRIPGPTEKQTIKTYVDGCRKCEEVHSKTPCSPLFAGACDEVVQNLVRKDATSLDITLEMIPRQMSPLESSRHNETNRVKRKSDVLLDSDDDDEDVVTASSPPKRPSSSSIARPGPSTTSNGDQQSRPTLSQRPMPITANQRQQKEKVVLRSRKPLQVDRKIEEQEQSDNDDDDSYSQRSDDSNSDSTSGSGSESDGENETERGIHHLRRSLQQMERPDSETAQVAVDPTEMEVQQSSPLNSPSKKLPSRSTTEATTSLHDSRERQSSSSNAARQTTATQSIGPTEGRQASTPPTVQGRQELSSESMSCIPTSQSLEPVSHSAGSSRNTNVMPSPAKLQAAKSPIKASTSQPVGSVEPAGVRPELTNLLDSIHKPFVPFSSLELSDKRLTVGCSDDTHSPVEDLFNGVTGSELLAESHYHDAEVFRKTLGSEELQPLDPLPSEIISNGEIVRERGQMTIGPVSSDTLRRGICLATLLREGGDLEEVVPKVDATFTANGEYAFNIFTEIRQLYSLDTVPVEWTELHNFSLIGRTVFMVAALQALDPNDLSSFVISEDHEMVWLPPKTGRLELEMHPLELLQHSPALGRKLRATVRADANFDTWVRNIADTKRALIEGIVRDAGLMMKDASRTIDLDYFGRFFNRLIAVLPWMKAR